MFGSAPDQRRSFINSAASAVVFVAAIYSGVLSVIWFVLLKLTSAPYSSNAFASTIEQVVSATALNAPPKAFVLNSPDKACSFQRVNNRISAIGLFAALIKNGVIV